VCCGGEGDIYKEWQLRLWVRMTTEDRKRGWETGRFSQSFRHGAGKNTGGVPQEKREGGGEKDCMIWGEAKKVENIRGYDETPEKELCKGKVLC